MKNHILFFCGIFLIFIYSVSAQDYYTAAVVEHAAISESNPRNTILKNLEFYRNCVEDARKQNVQIIVFPEYGLTTDKGAANPEQYAIDPNDQNESIIKDLKDMAYEHKIYLVVNLLEKSNSTNNKTLYYNTNLVFNTERNIVAKYRKINLFEEEKLTPGNKAATFYTKFGVTFGIFTCFDILFQNPSRTILESNITDVVFPTMWYSTLPFYHSLSVQQGYAQANRVNLLAANYDDPSNAQGGSGIYSADGITRTVYIDASHSSRMLVAKVNKVASKRDGKCAEYSVRGFPGGDKDDNKPNITDFVTRTNFKPDDYTFKNIDISQKNINKEVCHKSFCCTFDINIAKPNSNEIYKLMAYNGKVEFDKTDGYVKICSLLACTSNSIETCASRNNGTTVFSRIKVSSSLPMSSNDTFYQPVTLSSDLLPIKSRYCGSSNDDVFDGSLTMEQENDKILVFGIWGRGAGTANTNVASICLLVTLFIFKYIVN